MLKPSLRVLAGHAARARGLAVTNTSRLQRATTSLLIGGASVAVAAYFLLPDISRGAPTSDTKPLSPSHFTPAEVVSSTYASNGTKILTVAIPLELIPKGKDLFAPIWSVFIKDDDIQVERPYTPLDGVDEDGNMKFWIKRYNHGEVSRWLHSKKVGETIEIRGPLRTWSWRDDDWDEIVLVSKYAILWNHCSFDDYLLSRYQAVLELLHSTSCCIQSSLAIHTLKAESPCYIPHEHLLSCLHLMSSIPC
jgi:cytochrome-b5 reductase